MTAPAITALAPWFGCNRAKAGRVGALLGDLAWCGVPFCGGCPELPDIRTQAGVAADLHRHIITLATVIRDPDLCSRLRAKLDVLLFHDDVLAAAQYRLRHSEPSVEPLMFGDPPGFAYDDPVQHAADYFVAAWAGRGGHAGKKTELTQGLAARFTSSGGDSCKRFRSAIDSLPAWSAALRRWTFQCRDAFDLLSDCVDDPSHGLYVDPPWPDAGDEYRHAFTPRQHRTLRDVLRSFVRCRIVVRYGDHPLIRDLYPRCDGWTWHETATRNQRNAEFAEALITRNIQSTGAAGSTVEPAAPQASEPPAVFSTPAECVSKINGET